MRADTSGGGRYRGARRECLRRRAAAGKRLCGSRRISLGHRYKDKTGEAGSTAGSTAWVRQRAATGRDTGQRTGCRGGLRQMETEMRLLPRGVGRLTPTGCAYMGVALYSLLCRLGQTGTQLLRAPGRGWY